MKGKLYDLLPLSAVLIVLASMISVDVWIIGEPIRAVSALPMLVIILIWLAAVLKLRREK